MRSLIIVSACAFALYVGGFFGASQAAQGPNCELKQYASIDFTLNASDDIIFPLTIGDTQTFALLTLASGLNTIGPSAVDNLKLNRRRLSDITNAQPMVDGKQITQITAPVPVTIGQVRIGGVDFLITSDPSSNISARVGLGLFAQTDVEIDFSNQKLNLFSQEHCPGEVVYWAKSFGAVPFRKATFGNFLVMELEGKKIEASIGTGTAVTRLHGEVAKRLFDIDVETGGTKTGEGDRLSRERFMDLTANGIAVMNAQVDILPGRISGCRLRERKGPDAAAGYDQCYNVFPLQLGMNVLKKMHLYFALKENKLYFTPADAKN